MDDRKQSSSGARLASALANIARGAVSGGLHGAAVGAVTSFLPELVRAAVILICVLLILPMLVMAALPNIVFGYHSATSEDIVALTNQATSIDAAYRYIQNYNQEEIDRIIAELQAQYTGEDGPAFDEISVSKELDNTNIYWFIAITSVNYQQDLYSMSAAAIRNMTIGKITYSGFLVERTLKIDIADLDPEALMHKLRFTEEEKNWARVLYASLAESQEVGYDDSDGEGYYNTDYGDIVFSDAATPVVYYNQTDARWGNKMYGKTGTIGEAGCGPTALAIAVASLTSNRVTPEDVAKWSVKNGYRCVGNGSYHSLIPEGGAHYGLAVTPIGRDAKKLVEALSDGKLVIAIMTKGHFTNGGHFIVLRGVTAGGKILVADPASVKRSGQEWALGIITGEASRRAGAGGPFWILES